MKKRILWLLLPMALSAAPVAPERLPPAMFTASSGNWMKVANWREKAVPTSGYVNVTVADPVIIDSKIPSVMDIAIGYSSKASTLKIEDGAVITLSGSLRIPTWSKRDAVGYLWMTGGELYTGLDPEGLAGIRVGQGASYSGQGFATISGGLYRGSLRIGSRLPGTQTGTLSIVGGKADIAGVDVPRHYLVLEASGTLVFMPDASGIAELDYKKSRVILSKDCHIIADGSAYKGGAKTFVLMSTERFKDDGAVLETRNFPTGTTATLAFEKKGKVTQLLLKIAGK